MCWHPLACPAGPPGGVRGGCGRTARSIGVWPDCVGPEQLSDYLWAIHNSAVSSAKEMIDPAWSTCMPSLQSRRLFPVGRLQGRVGPQGKAGAFLPLKPVLFAHRMGVLF